MEAPAVSNVEYDFYSEKNYSLICFSLGRVLLQNSSIKFESTQEIYGILQKPLKELVVANSDIELISHLAEPRAQLTYHTMRSLQVELSNITTYSSPQPLGRCAKTGEPARCDLNVTLVLSKIKTVIDNELRECGEDALEATLDCA